MDSEKKVYDIFHWRMPYMERGLILIPIGLYYNVEIQQAKKGDFIRFQEDNEPKEIISITQLGLKTAMAEFMCQYIYNLRLSVVMERWLSNAVIEGNGKDAVSRNKCLVIWYKDDGSEI